MAVTARGLAKAAEILAGQFTLVATNVPYLGSRKQDDTLKNHLEQHFRNSKPDLATAFVERCLAFCAKDGSTALVTPQNWLFLGIYSTFRESLLTHQKWNIVARLGPKGFQTPMWDFNIQLGVISATRPCEGVTMAGIDVTDATTAAEKSTRLGDQNATPIVLASQADQLRNPDARIVIDPLTDSALLNNVASFASGMLTGDGNRFFHFFWELMSLAPDWECLQSSVTDSELYGGRSQVVLWQQGVGELFAAAQSVKHLNTAVQRWRTGQEVWGKKGILVSRMSGLECTIYLGDRFDDNVGVICPNEESLLAAIWCYCSSPQFGVGVRNVDQALKVTNSSLVKVPFDLAHWQKLAVEKYPHGLPMPFSSDPTQWLFNGHPAGADQPLHVAVARLLGYQWPRQTGSSFPDCSALGPDGLEKLADDDGIVPISPAKGEGPAAERLRELLARAYGKDWNATRQEALLAQVDYAGASLEDWLRNGFFEQHCALFHHRPFIWHVWDGLKNGFSALVNYHKLTHANLEKLTYAYLGDWIRRQQAAVEAGEAGSDARQQAAKQLQARLKLLLEGEPPYDLFVRWKPLSKQAIGWHPDMNDGVRMNIRPFLAQDIPGGKKGAGILRTKPNIKWEKDRGKEPVRDKKEFPWFWGWDEQKQDFAGIGKEPDGNRWNDCHYTSEFKQRAQK